jgi:hypothetical protein
MEALRPHGGGISHASPPGVGNVASESAETQDIPVTPTPACWRPGYTMQPVLNGSIEPRVPFSRRTVIAPVLVYPASTTRMNAGKCSFATARLMAKMTSSFSVLGAAFPPSRRNSSLRTSLGLSLAGFNVIGLGWVATAVAWICRFLQRSLFNLHNSLGRSTFRPETSPEYQIRTELCEKH